MKTSLVAESFCLAVCKCVILCFIELHCGLPNQLCVHIYIKQTDNWSRREAFVNNVAI